MPETPYQILGTSIPPLVGRGTQLRQIMAEFSKKTPSHVSVVGPKYSGKSVLLKAVCEQHQQAGSPFSATVFWDLAHHTPSSDEEFMSGLAAQLAKARPEYEKEFLAATYGDLKEIIESFSDDGFRILMAWDGFDRPLQSGSFSRNLWDNLLELARQPSLRLMTATRRPLQELIRDEKSVSSDFWGIFGLSTRIGAFEDADIDAVFDGHGVSLSKGAKTEFVNHTGLYPPIALAMANRLIVDKPDGEIDNAHVVKESEAVFHDVREILASIWHDCDEPARGLFADLMQAQSLSLGDTSPASRFALVERGLAVSASGRLTKTSRLMEQFVRTLDADSGTLARQFGRASEYAPNMRSVLQLRLAQIEGIDPRLKRLVELCLEDLPAAADLCLTHVRDVGVRMADLMLIAELGADLEIPNTWILELQEKEFLGDRVRVPAWCFSGRCPHETRDRIELLKLIINPRNIQPRAKTCSRLAIELVQVLKRLGDYGEHSGREPIPLESALSAVNIAVEAAALLTSELTAGSQGGSHV
jgi:hypothetical protein